MQEVVVFSRVRLPLANREAQVADGLLLVVVLVDELLLVVVLVDDLLLVGVLVDDQLLVVVWQVGRTVHHCSYAQSGQ